MQHMLVRNKVRDFDTWKAIFDQQMGVARAAGLELVHLWRSQGDPNEVYFLFTMQDRERAEAYVTAPESAEVGVRSGVIDGEIVSLEVAGP